MPVALPLVPSVPNYRFSTSLEGVQYIFDVRWNTRAASWYMDVSTEADEIIAYGLRLVLGSALGSRNADPRFPPGILIMFDNEGTGREAGLDDIGTRVSLLYYTPDEITA